MTDDPNYSPPFTIEVLDQLEEVRERATRFLRGCNFPDTKELDYVRAFEGMRTYATEDLRIRLQFILNLDVYPPKWPVVAGEQSVRAALSWFPERTFYAQTGEGFVWEDARQFSEHLALTISNQLDRFLIEYAKTARRLERDNNQNQTESLASKRLKRPMPSSSDKDELNRRHALLDEYKAANHLLPNQRIYRARNSGIHKPEFYKWLNGTLSATSETTINFERFLREKKPPIPRKPKR